MSQTCAWLLCWKQQLPVADKVAALYLVSSCRGKELGSRGYLTGILLLLLLYLASAVWTEVSAFPLSLLSRLQWWDQKAVASCTKSAYNNISLVVGCWPIEVKHTYITSVYLYN